MLLVFSVFQDETGPLQCLVNSVKQHRKILDRLEEVVPGPAAQGLDHIRNNTGSGHHDNRRIGRVFLNPIEDLQSINFRHAQIHQDQIRPFLLQQLQAHPPVFRLQHIIIIVFQKVPEALANRPFIVYDKNPLGYIIRHDIPFSYVIFHYVCGAMAETSSTLFSP